MSVRTHAQNHAYANKIRRTYVSDFVLQEKPMFKVRPGKMDFSGVFFLEQHPPLHPLLMILQTVLLI